MHRCRVRLPFSPSTDPLYQTGNTTGNTNFKLKFKPKCTGSNPKSEYFLQRFLGASTTQKNPNSPSTLKGRISDIMQTLVRLGNQVRKNNTSAFTPEVVKLLSQTVRRRAMLSSPARSSTTSPNAQKATPLEADAASKGSHPQEGPLSFSDALKQGDPDLLCLHHGRRWRDRGFDVHRLIPEPSRALKA